MSTSIMQSLTFIKFIVSKKIALLKFLPCTDNQLASLTLVITKFMRVEKKKLQFIFLT